MKEQENLQKEATIQSAEQKSADRFLPLEEARTQRFVYKEEASTRPNMLGIMSFLDFDIDEIIKYIDWTPFFHGWDLKGKFPSIFEKERVGPEAKRLFDEGLEMLEKMKEQKIVRPKAVIGLFPANSQGDDILLYEDEHRDRVIAKFPMLRQQKAPRNQGYTLSLADFVAPVDSGIKDYFGGFAVTTGHGMEEYVEAMKESGDSYTSVMFRLVSDRLVEAAAEMIHEWVRKDYWGYDADEELSAVERIQGKYRGIRPAIGYPICPDHRLKRYLFDLLNAEQTTGMSLTETYTMKPASSVSGFYLGNSASKYFGVGKIGMDQVHDYAERAGEDVERIADLLQFTIDKNA